MRGAPSWAVHAGARGSGPEQRFSTQLLPGVACPRQGSPSGSFTATTGTAPRSTAQGRWSKPGVESGHNLPAYHRARDLAVPLSGDRPLEPQDGGWDVAEREDPAIAPNLVSRPCLRERISRGRKQPLILHADNVNAMRAVTLERRLVKRGVLRSFSRPRVSSVTTYSESLYRTAKYRTDYPRQPLAK